MDVSVVLCTYTMDRFDDYVEAVESVINQTYNDIELILVSDGDPELYAAIEERFGDRDDVLTLCNPENVGLSVSRNNAIEIASGDVVALIDDDAIAEPDWIEQLISVYEETDAIAVGGRMDAEWVAGKPDFLPEEFYFLVGVNRSGFAEDGEEVRNTYGSNISFKREVLEELGGFEKEVGRKGEKNLQAHETEFCTRMRAEYGRGVVVNLDAVVRHKVFDYRTDPVWLAKRAFMQGYSKRGLEVLLPEAQIDEEADFLKELLVKRFPGRVRSFVSRPSAPKAKQLVALVLLVGLVGIGYLYGIVKWR